MTTDRIERNPGSTEDYELYQASRHAELAAGHDALLVDPAQKFAREIGGPVTYQVMTQAHEIEPEPHADREW